MFKSSIPKVSIIDFGVGNLFSVKQACSYAGMEAIITSEKEILLKSAGAILPGVGAFGLAISNLKKLDLINPILDFIQSGKPFMGICLGMQLLMSESEEFGRHKGLDIIKGNVIKFSTNNENEDMGKVPQVGWNRINNPLYANEVFRNDTPLSGISNGEFMYFVHSYYCKPWDYKTVLSVTEYNDVEYCSSIQWKNIFATQFHPEKSALDGLKIYKNWSLLLKNRKRG